MEVSTQKMTPGELNTVKNILYRNNMRLRKVIVAALCILLVTLFVPVEVLSLLSRRGSSGSMTGAIFFEFGPMNTLFFILLPVAVLIVLIYLYILHIPKIKKDIKEQVKEIGVIKVKEVKKLSDRDLKDLQGISDHIIKFESNPFHYDEEYFLEKRNPELMHAKAYRVEVSRTTKIELSKEIISEEGTK